MISHRMSCCGRCNIDAWFEILCRILDIQICMVTSTMGPNLGSLTSPLSLLWERLLRLSFYERTSRLYTISRRHNPCLEGLVQRKRIPDVLKCGSANCHTPMTEVHSQKHTRRCRVTEFHIDPWRYMKGQDSRCTSTDLNQQSRWTAYRTNISPN